jgi:elongation of very long chain fatty acids protein 4
MEMVEGAWKAVDMRVTQLVWSLLRNVMGVELTGTPTTKGLPLIDSPTPIVVAITIYLSCVIGGLLWIKAFNLKPRAQEPALLQALVLLHNFFCFGLSLYMCIGIIYQAILNRYFSSIPIAPTKYTYHFAFLELGRGLGFPPPCWSCTVV